MRTTTTKPSGLVESRVRCQVACPVREAAPGKRTGRKTGTAPRADFTNICPLTAKLVGPKSLTCAD